MSVTKVIIDKLDRNPHIEGNVVSIEILEKVLLAAINAYYNTDKPILRDASYDILEKILKQRKPSSEIFKQIGAPIANKADVVKLPYYLGSLDKVYPNEKSLTRWLKEHNKNIVISEKLDGLSSLLVINPVRVSDNNLVNSMGVIVQSFNMQLFKHGDGFEGQDISHLLNNISIGSIDSKTIQTMIDNPENKKNHIALRGEIIIKNSIYNAKYSKMYPKARSLIAGIVNSKKPNVNIVQDMEIIFYEFINPSDMTFENQFIKLEKLGFNIAKYKLFKTLEHSQIPEILLDFKKKSQYEIDGIVLDDSSKVWPRATKRNPEYAVAFKMALEDQVANTVVTNVEYNISKHGTLAPRIEYKPIVIKGDTHKYTTGFNLKYIIDNKINIGTEIQIIKSGDVIPYINKIIKASSEPMMPDKKIKWHWNETKVDGVLDNPEESEDVLLKKLVAFFSIMKISGVGEGVLNKLLTAGYNDLQNILELKPDMIAQIEGFQAKSALNVYNAIHKVIEQAQPLERVMAASGIFTLGLGEKKFKLIIDAIPNFIQKYKNAQINKTDILAITGFSNKTTDIFLDGIPKFIEWLNIHNMIKIDSQFNNNLDSKPTGNKFAGMIAVFTGVRNSNFEKAIVNGGGQIASGVTNKTTIVIAKDPTENSSKLQKARDMNIEVIGIDNFCKKYSVN
jgi:NAD-dependent DNA ligase